MPDKNPSFGESLCRMSQCYSQFLTEKLKSTGILKRHICTEKKYKCLKKIIFLSQES